MRFAIARVALWLASSHGPSTEQAGTTYACSTARMTPLRVSPHPEL